VTNVYVFDGPRRYFCPLCHVTDAYGGADDCPVCSEEPHNQPEGVQRVYPWKRTCQPGQWP
jgi:nitrate reductase cytochrome c-type subunit